MNEWIGVDLDGTLAEYHGWPDDGSIGKPILAMVERVKKWLAEGKDVRIFTARVFPLGTDQANRSHLLFSEWRMNDAAKQQQQIYAWCKEHLGKILAVTCTKDYSMIELWDDRAIQVIPNTGETVAEYYDSGSETVTAA